MPMLCAGLPAYFLSSRDFRRLFAVYTDGVSLTVAPRQVGSARRSPMDRRLKVTLLWSCHSAPFP